MCFHSATTSDLRPCAGHVAETLRTIGIRDAVDRHPRWHFYLVMHACITGKRACITGSRVCNAGGRACVTGERTCIAGEDVCTRSSHACVPPALRSKLQDTKPNPGEVGTAKQHNGDRHVDGSRHDTHGTPRPLACATLCNDRAISPRAQGLGCAASVPPSKRTSHGLSDSAYGKIK